MSDDKPTHDDALPPDLEAEAAALLAELDQALDALPGQDAPASEPDVDTGAMLAGLLQITFNNLIAPRRGKHWEMNQDECASLGQAYGAVIDKYFPNMTTGPELTAVLVTVAVIGPRIAIDAANAEKTEAPAGASDQVIETTGKPEKFGFEEGGE